MPTPLPFSEIHLINIFVESVLYGIYLVSCGFCLLLLLRTQQRWRKSNEVQWVMLGITIFLIINNTVSSAITLWRCIDAFIYNADNPLRTFAALSRWDNVYKTASIQVSIVVIDGILIYRSWIVYSRKFLVTIPSFILWAGVLSCCIKSLHVQATNKGPATVTSTQVALFTEIAWALSLALNILTTSLIIYRLWKVDKSTRGYRYTRSDNSGAGSTLKTVIRAFMESGFLYTSTTIITVIVNVSKSNGFYVMANSERIFASIAFNLIIIETARGRERRYAAASQTAVSTANSSRTPGSTIPLKFFPGSPGSNTQTNSNGLQIKVQQEVEERHDAHEVSKYQAV